MGATDVCPLIPIKNVSLKECIKYSKILAKRVANELKIPIYLYELSSEFHSYWNMGKDNEKLSLLVYFKIYVRDL